MSIAKHRDPSQRIHRPRSATATREQLLDAAIDLFASQGIAATTVAQIARQVGVTSAMIHYYFNTREQLLDAIVTEKIAGIISHVTEPLTVDCDDPVVMVHSILERFADVAEKMPWFPSLWTREIINEGGLLRERMFRHIPVVRLGQLSDPHCCRTGAGKYSCGYRTPSSVYFDSRPYHAASLDGKNLDPNPASERAHQRPPHPSRKSTA